MSMLTDPSMKEIILGNLLKKLKVVEIFENICFWNDILKIILK